MKVKRKNGEMYEPDTLTSFHCSFHRYLANKKYLPFNILEFTSSRESLKAARKMLKKQGKRNRPQAVMSLSNEDIVVANWCTGLFESRILNAYCMVSGMLPYGYAGKG